MKVPSIRFSRRDERGFFQELRKRVDHYFTENNLKKTGGARMVIKATGMLLFYLTPYILLFFGPYSTGVMILLCIWMGIGLAGVGMGVMHDACHSAFSDKQWVNRLFSASMYLVGGNVYNWKIQHNTLHHTFTNIHHADEDIAGKALLRLDRHDEHKPLHRFQHWYGPMLYTLMTISFHIKDFRQVFEWASQSSRKVYIKEVINLFIGKLVFFTLMLLPFFFLPISFGQWIIGFLLVNFTAGFILAAIFQLAHIVEETDQPLPDEKGQMENTWAIHQLHTTADFSRKSKVLGWYAGGLNFQVEHHLFPNICHLHYPKISEIVERTAAEFGIPYHAHPSLVSATTSHLRTLRRLGQG
ncbi:MAG: fatty acid desaturase family protein [Bacteroidia bacterium]